MSKVEELELVADMVGLEADYVVEEADFFRSVKEELINVLASITVEDLQEENANSVAEYMILQDKDTYITKSGVAYLRIQR